MRVEIRRLRRRPDYLRVAKSRSRCVTPAFVLQARRSESTEGLSTVGVGLTVSRKVGGAVVRNRARRRLRVVIQAVLPLHGAPGHDLVLVARSDAVTRPIDAIRADLEGALRSVGAWRDGRA